MNKTIDKLRAEHRNLVKLLSVLKREIDSYASGGTADFDLVNDILTYHQRQ